ncbi:hypothetical protein ACHAPJ_009128 [Fusarium lateritium]
MLRRNSSRKKDRRSLSRSKSTNSVVRSPIRNLESIDPAEAERDANIAAVLSYHRAKDRPSSEGMSIPRDPASFYPDKSDDTGSVVRQSFERNDSALSRHGTSTIARQKSVRFAGPSACPRRNLASRANGGRDSPTKATSTIHAFGNANTRPSSTLSFRSERPDNYSLTRRYLESLQPPDACYNPEDDAVSIPSTFKKVRKSRSMMTSSHPMTGTVSSKNWPAKNRLTPAASFISPANNENEHLKDTISQSAGPRASTSMSFLKSRRRMAASRSSSRAEDNDLAIQLARERFRQIQEQPRQESQPATLFRSRNRQSEGFTSLRKSLRNSSNNSTALSSAFSTNSISVPKQGGIRKTARKVSHGLKSKLRGLFGRGKSVEGSEQQEEDRCSGGKESDGESCSHFGDGETTDEASMFRVTSHIPSLHDVPSNQQVRSRKGSVESLGDGERHIPDDKSRVTSWTNSVTNTVTSTGTLGDWERQRLSVIKENGTHVPSSLRSIEPLEQETRDLIADMSIDSERVYSALMKRLAQKSPRETATQAHIFPDRAKDTSSEQGGERCQPTTKQWDCSTIRCVRPDDDIFRDAGDHSSRSSSSATEVPTADFNHLPQTVTAPTHEDWNNDRVNSESERVSVTSGLEPPKALSQRSSAFFASPSCHSFRSPSPYRRALQAGMMTSPEQGREGLPGSQYLHSLSALSLPVRQNSNSCSEKDFQVGDTESVYSCAADDGKPSPRAPDPTHLGQSTAYSHGSSTLPPEFSNYRLGHQHQRDTSTASSVEWKTWLSSKVSKLEAPQTPTKRDNGWQATDILPPLGHVREHASMGSTPEIFAPTNDGTANRSPLSRVKGNAQTLQDIHSPTRPRHKAVIGYDENASPSYSTDAYVKEQPPSIPPRSTLRAVPSLPTVGSRNNILGSGSAKEMHRMRSLNTIGRLNSTPEEAVAKRRSRARLTGWQGSPTKSSPGVGALAEVHHRRPTNGSPVPKGGYSSSYSTPRSHVVRGKAGKPGEAPKESEMDAQAMGSKTMVDMFLSSRRSRGDGGSSGFGSSLAAFL